MLLMGDIEDEPRDDNGTPPACPVSSPVWVDENSQLPEEYIQKMRNLSLTSHQQSDSSVRSRDDEDETTVNDMCVTATSSEQQGSPEEETASSQEWQPAIRCPICMDFYSRILKSKRLFMSTQCVHVFCSRCLPVAIEITRACPTCSTELTHRQYHPIYI